MNQIVTALLIAFILTPAWAIENGNSYQTTVPTDAQVANWTSGWGGNGITGWNYVGQVGAASGVYLGNSWVLTAAHVGIGNLVLGGNTYAAIAGSAQSISNANGTADLCLFRINTTSINNSTPLSLPALVLRQSDPIAFAYGTTGSSVMMIGYGGGQGESWGVNTITQINELITPNGYSYVSNDFLTFTGTTTYNNPRGPGSESITNNAQVVGGDSGGGDFIYNSATSQWDLAGINEVAGTASNGQNVSGFVQLNTYASQINPIVHPPATDSPTIPLPGLGIMACLLFLAASHSFRTENAPARKRLIK